MNLFLEEIGTTPNSNDISGHVEGWTGGSGVIYGFFGVDVGGGYFVRNLEKPF